LFEAYLECFRQMGKEVEEGDTEDEIKAKVKDHDHESSRKKAREFLEGEPDLMLCLGKRVNCRLRRRRNR
jgi:hypothetical protein